MFRKSITAATAVAALLGGGTLAVALAGAASAASATTTYTKNGVYEFASNNGTIWQIGTDPVVTPEATESLGANGVTLTTTPSASAGYADAGVIVPLGDLNSLYSSGKYVGPDIVGSGSASLAYNLYFDTNGDGGFLSFSSDGVYQGPGGDNIADMGALNNTNDSPVFQAGQQGTEALAQQVATATTMEQVLADFQASSNQDPQVWAWIGVSGSTAQSATITSVNGTNLVTANTTTPDSVSVSYVCGTGQSDYRWNVALSGSSEAKVNDVSLTGTAPKTKWIWDGSFYIHPGRTDQIATHDGYRLGVYYDTDGSQPAPKEAGASFAQAAAPAAANRHAC